MKELDMIKSFAKLEGIEIVDEYCGKLFIKDVASGSVSIKGYSHSSYNPIDNLALNCAARDKYEVEVSYSESAAYIYKKLICDENDSSSPTNPEAGFKTKTEISKAVIECILKSKGKWNES